MLIHVCICIYIYIERERDIDMYCISCIADVGGSIDWVALLV